LGERFTMPVRRFAKPERELSKMPSWRAASGSISIRGKDHLLPPMPSLASGRRGKIDMLTGTTPQPLPSIFAVLLVYLLLCSLTVALACTAIGHLSDRLLLMNGIDPRALSRHSVSSTVSR